jgi:hypothetical protein
LRPSSDRKGIGAFEIGGADEKDMAFLSAMERSHGMHIEKHAFTFGGGGYPAERLR